MAQKAGNAINRGFGISLTSQEFQLLECVIENEDDVLNMSDYNSITGINKSSLTVAAKKLMNYELIEKYKLAGNKKNIILKPTKKGIELYNHFVLNSCEQVFEELFEKLSGLSDDQLQAVVDAIMSLDKEITPMQELIKQE